MPSRPVKLLERELALWPPVKMVQTSHQQITDIVCNLKKGCWTVTACLRTREMGSRLRGPPALVRAQAPQPLERKNSHKPKILTK